MTLGLLILSFPINRLLREYLHVVHCIDHLCGLAWILNQNSTCRRCICVVHSIKVRNKNFRLLWSYWLGLERCCSHVLDWLVYCNSLIRRNLLLKVRVLQEVGLLILNFWSHFLMTDSWLVKIRLLTGYTLKRNYLFIWVVMTLIESILWVDRVLLLLSIAVITRCHL